MIRKDLNQLAFSIVQQATDDTPQAVITDHQANSRKGGIVGGAARAKKLSAEERRAIAAKAAAARWRSNKP